MTTSFMQFRLHYLVLLRVVCNARLDEFGFSEDMEAPQFITELTKTKILVGETAILECKVTGKPAPEVRWMMGGADVKQSMRLTVKSKPDGVQVLQVKEATQKETGEVKCIATNKAGTVETAAELTVEGMLGSVFSTIMWRL